MAGEAKNGILPYKGGTYYLWHYVPSMPGAVIFILLFILATAAHSYRMFRFRQWFYIPFILGCIFEAIGYVGFAVAHSKTDQLMPFIIQSVFILVAPALFAATVYMILGRLIVRVPSGPSCSLIRPSWLTKTFVVGDVFSFMLQSAGGGMMAMEGKQDLGQNILLVGLFVQIVMFGLFMIVTVAFHVRYGRMLAVSGAYGSGGGGGGDRSGSNLNGIPWLKVLYMLYSVSLLIMVRSIFRVIEYVMGQDGYPLNNQWTLFIFDSLLMFLVTALFFFMFHPNDMVGSQQDIGYDEVGTSTSVDVPLQQKTRAQAQG